MCEHAFVRWDSQTTEQEAKGRLPGYTGTVVRHFDPPEALDVRFHEIQTKSALNRVPAAARLPFRWTINPYRGCTHACQFCLWGKTPVLMADGRARNLEDLRVGDEIIGTERRGAYRRYVRTEVLAHWSTIKPVYAIRLEDGTRLLASGDHRFLTGRGWKHVADTPRSEPDRPHLTINNSLLGTGRLAEGPREDADYRRGYLCGLIRGDGRLWSRDYVRSGRAWTARQFRLALTDLDALRRAQRYLEDIGVPLAAQQYKVAAGYTPMRAIRSGSGASFEAVSEAVRWPLRRAPNLSWRKGFLAGIVLS